LYTYCSIAVDVRSEVAVEKLKKLTAKENLLRLAQLDKNTNIQCIKCFEKLVKHI